jgi:hypothetical protein
LILVLRDVNQHPRCESEVLLLTSLEPAETILSSP